MDKREPVHYNRPRSFCGSHSLTKTKLQDRAHLSWERHDSDLETGSILCIAGTVRKNIAKKNTGKIKSLYFTIMNCMLEKEIPWDGNPQAALCSSCYCVLSGVPLEV